MSKKKRHLVTAALIYANGPIHIGHLAGCYIPSDLYVRFLRSNGEDVRFISGTDEHGVPITIKARDENKSPQQVVDFYYDLINKSFQEFGISFDIFSRTSKKYTTKQVLIFLLIYTKKEYLKKLLHLSIMMKKKISFFQIGISWEFVHHVKMKMLMVINVNLVVKL